MMKNKMQLVLGVFAMGAWMAGAAVVPIDKPALVLANANLADVQTNRVSGVALGKCMFPSSMTGYHPTVLAKQDGRPSKLRLEMQYSDNYHLKCIVLELTEGAGGVWGRAVAGRYVVPHQPSIGVYRFVNADGSFNGQEMALVVDNAKFGYGVRDLTLQPQQVRGPAVDAAPAVCDPAAQIATARGVIARFAGAEVAQALKLEIIPYAPGGLPVFEIAQGGRVLRASNGATLAKAFYEDVRRKGAGICSWSGNRFDKAMWEKSAPDLRVVSPFRRHVYTQPCTASYSTAFWDEARWMQEIDWMALHGFDFPIAVIAYEAIAERVWRQMGLTQEEIEASFAGPAYLGFSRMGCIAGKPSRLPPVWRARELKLQHAVNDRMRALGMEPILQGFAGIVPAGIRRLHPDAKMSQLEWVGFHTWFLHPDQALFAEIGRAITREWEKEFGKGTCYLCDSFIEMSHAMPWRKDGPEAMRKGLSDSMRNMYASIHDVNPDAMLAFQDWIFFNGRRVWTKDLVKAFLEPVPADKMLVIEMCVDAFNRHRGRYAWHWDLFNAFEGRRWAWCTIPDYGGNTLPGGDLEFYANGHLAALASANRGSLFAYGTMTEAIEVEDVIFELMASAGWRDQPLDLTAWLANYTQGRWGLDGATTAEYWRRQLKSFYGCAIEDVHAKTFNWQRASFAGNATLLKEHLAVLAALRELAPKAGANPIFQRDYAVETAHVAGHLAEVLLAKGGAQNQDRAFHLLEGIDAVLRGHPTHDLRVTLARARAAANGEQALADFYETDIRRIITVWAPRLGDYAARVWSGLVKDYYLPRLKLLRRQRETGEKVDLRAWELNLVEQRSPLSGPDTFWTVDKLAEETLRAAGN